MSRPRISIATWESARKASEVCHPDPERRCHLYLARQAGTRKQPHPIVRFTANVETSIDDYILVLVASFDRGAWIASGIGAEKFFDPS